MLSEHSTAGDKCLVTTDEQAKLNITHSDRGLPPIKGIGGMEVYPTI